MIAANSDPNPEAQVMRLNSLLMHFSERNTQRHHQMSNDHMEKCSNVHQRCQSLPVVVYALISSAEVSNQLLSGESCRTSAFKA